MSIFSSLSKGGMLKAAIQQVAEARKSEGGRAEQLFKSAYKGFAKVIEGDLNTAEALYNWGFGLLHEAKGLAPEKAAGLLNEAIEKFTFCALVIPAHLGAAIDGGVAYMELARVKNVATDDVLYQKALQCFERADDIQKGSAAYNAACIYVLQGDQAACKEALEKAREYGSLPDEEEVLNDPDMASVKFEPWFQDFLGKVAIQKVEQQANDKFSRRGLKKVEELKLNMDELPPRPTDSMLKRHYDQMLEAKLAELKEQAVEKKRREAEAKSRIKKTETFDYYK
jgi:tetratricopeptide (TPR) repeat protein